MNTKNIDIKIVMAAVLGIGLGAAGGLMVSQAGYNEMSMEHSMSDEMMMHDKMGNDEMSMHESMDGMMAALEGKTGDAFDKAFLSEMTTHHEGAVVMAQAALRDAKHQEVKDLAQNIITAQNSEIAQMKAWQKTWYGASGAQSQ